MKAKTIPCSGCGTTTVIDLDARNGFVLDITQVPGWIVCPNRGLCPTCIGTP